MSASPPTAPTKIHNAGSDSLRFSDVWESS
ncbi:Uncharacterised protein [Mycolicibacterium chubuense]|nr:Uncharacterised protein [Mycolicibacterium chubuense]